MAELQYRRHDSEDDDSGIATMGFLEHLDELAPPPAREMTEM